MQGASIKRWVRFVLRKVMAESSTNQPARSGIRVYSSGGMRDPRQVSFYHSAAWLKCRAAYIKSVNGLCERCKARGIYRPGYIVHHLVHLGPDNLDDPSILLSWDNLEYLCMDCHNLEHFGSGNEKRYEVTFDGKILPKEEWVGEKI